MADYLHIHSIDLITPEPFLSDYPLDVKIELIVLDIMILMRKYVVQMDVSRWYDIEEHLVRGTEPVLVYSEKGHLREDIVHRGCSDFTAAALDLFTHHIRTGVDQFEHRLMDFHPLGCSLHIIRFEHLLERFDVQSRCMMFFLQDSVI